jgi:hypothetical protein
VAVLKRQLVDAFGTEGDACNVPATTPNAKESFGDTAKGFRPMYQFISESGEKMILEEKELLERTIALLGEVTTALFVSLLPHITRSTSDQRCAPSRCSGR